MRVVASVAVTFALAALPSSVFADTGVLDRSVSVDGQNHRYKVYVPAQWTHSQKWPVIMFLHGNGRQGLDGSVQLAGGSAASALAAIFAEKTGFPAVVIFPQAAPDSSWAVPPMLDMVSRQLDATIKDFNGDQDRIYLWGHSMGGSGALRLASHSPDRFAALAESSGNVEPPAVPPRRSKTPSELSSRISPLPIGSPHLPPSSAIYRFGSFTAMLIRRFRLNSPASSSPRCEQ